ncbi:Outer membrane protein A precursor [hydrothermal vent metagenome]|uniref:Outer membrane protein A n=1 Tax=hydrothermal vent metagenome TaxID=652676 RepID=A0A3B0Z042_9ZZZZ
MKQTGRIFLIACSAVMVGTGEAAPGYVDVGDNSIIRAGSGDCVHTQRWSVPNAIVQCDPEIVAKRDGTDTAAMEVIMVTKRNLIRLKADMLFGFDKASLTDNGKSLLDELMGDLTADNLLDQKILIRGYADRIGSEDYNLALSKQRAEAVGSYLVSRGLVPSFIETSGLGSADPIVDCVGERGASLVNCLAPNRRTEIEFSAVEVTEVEEIVPVK